MVKIINKIATKESLYVVYSDFIEMSALAISNTCDFANKDRRENQYTSITKKYREEIKLFQELFSELVKTMDKGFNDVLGSLYMALELGSKNTWQFFTPYNLAQATARIIFNKTKNQIFEKGYISLHEPSVGGGAMVIALAEEMYNNGYNPQEQLVVECNDLDLKGVYMSYVQLSLYGIPAIINHADSLKMEKYDTFKTPFYLLGGWDVKRRGMFDGR